MTFGKGKFKTLEECKLANKDQVDADAYCKSIEDPANPTAQKTTDQIVIENETLQLQIKEKNALIENLTNQLKAANDILEGQTKGKIIKEILPKSKFTKEDLDKKTIDELITIKQAVDSATPTHKNIHIGEMDTTLSDRERGLTVGDLYKKKIGEQ
jgi:hypothetical protein